MSTSFLNEFKKLKTDKLIIFVIVILPLFVNLILGWELSNEQIRHIPMAIVDQDNSPLSRMIIEYFSQNEYFDVKYYPQNEIELEALIKSNDARTGMIIPKDFSKDSLALKSPTILMIYDGSHMSIASTAKSKASEILLTVRTGVAIKQIKARFSLPEDVATTIATAIKFNNTTLYNPAKSFKNFLTPGFGIAIVQSGIVLMAAVAVDIEELKKWRFPLYPAKLRRTFKLYSRAGKTNISKGIKKWRLPIKPDGVRKKINPITNAEKINISYNKRKRRGFIGYFLGKVSFYGAIGAISMMLSVFVQSIIFQVPFRGRYLDAFILCTALSFSASSFAIMISAWFDNKAVAIIANGLFFIPSTILAGYTWPIMAMPTFYKVFATIIPFSFVANNLRNIYLKGSSITSMYSDLTHLLLYFLITAIIGTIGVHLKKGDISNETVLETNKARVETPV